MLAKAKPSLTLAILAFNEETNVGFAIREAIEFLSGALDDWEIIVIDDGSTDGTAAIASAAATNEPRIRVVSHACNRGMGAGIASAIRAATKAWFVFNAADGQIAMAEIAKLFPLLDRADIVLSIYENGRETAARAALSRAFRVYLRLVAGVRFELEGLYLYPTAAAKELAPRIDAETFFFSFALVALGLERGLRAATTGIRCAPRRAGASKVVRPRKIAAVAVEAARFGVARRLGR
jgi:glycosyltransferase involved in cell wall biosynthesis